jgi:hypothetical protein
MQEFGLLPVIANGRVQPLESLARNHLLAIQGKQNVRGENAPGTSAAWLAELAFQPRVADARKIFLIHHDDLLGVTGLSGSAEKVFSFDALRPSFSALQQESARIEKIEPGARSAYETSLMRLTRNLTAYNQLKHSLALPHMTNAETEFRSFTEKVTAAMTAASGKEPPKDQALMEEASRRMREILAWVPYTEVFVCPSPHSLEDWRKLPDAVIDSAQQAQLHPAALAYARMGDAYRAGQWDQFETVVREYRLWLAAQCPRPARKCIAETWFQRLAPFYHAMPLYIVAFVMAAVSWLRPNPAWQLAAFRVLMIGFLLHTAGLVTRMILEGRPPVTNLYSSAIFIGWGVIVLGIILERYHRNGIGTAVASLIGFATLLIAHHLSLSGDTLEMMRAVLDTNFWLATHVVIITLGYSSCFLAGFLAIAWILRRLKGNMTSATSASMRGMVSHTRRCVSRIMAASSPTSPLMSSTRSCTGRSISSVCDTANHERGDGKGLMSPVGSNLCNKSGRSCNSDRISGRTPRVMAWLTKSSMVVDTSMSHIRFCSGAAKLNVTPRSVLRLPAAMTIHSAGMPKSSGVSVSW